MLVDWNGVRATLPYPMYRRSFFIYEQFVTLLYRLDPKRAKELRDATCSQHYAAVMEYCAKRFPITGYWVGEDEEYCDMVPVESQGWSPYDNEIVSPAIAVCIVAHRTTVDWDAADEDAFMRHHFECLNRITLLPNDLGRERIDPRTIVAPCGRTWRKPWDGLADLYRWANGLTNINWLDISDMELAEGCFGYPMWDEDEIKSLERHWSAAKPIFDRALALAKFVDADPLRNVSLLASALLRHPHAIKQVTAPIRRGTLRAIWRRR